MSYEMIRDKMICVICGKNQAVDHGMCEECIKENIKVEAISQVNLAFCPKCGSIRIGKKWYKNDYAGRLMPVLMDELKCTDRDAVLTGNPKSIVMNDQDKTISFEISIDRKYIDSMNEKISVPYSVSYISCPTCNKFTGSYYEAVIQLRTVSTEYDDSLNNVLDSIGNIMEKRKRIDAASFISKVEKKAEGIDIYLGKKNDGDMLSSFVMDHFFSNIIVTKTLAGVKDGRKFYRYTYSLRILDAGEGSLVSVDHKNYILTAVRNKHIDVIDVDTERKIRINRNTFFMKDGRIVTKEPQMRKFIVISRSGDESQLMDVQNFRIITIRGKPEGDEVNLFTYKGKYFL